MVRFLGLMAFLLAGLITTAQQDAILVIDAKSKEPVPFANICIEGLRKENPRHFLTDMQGKIPFTVKEVAKVAVSCMGYETYQDTLFPGKVKTVYLHPTIYNMQEVVVTAQFAPERADKSIYRVNVINSRQIEQKAATNLNELLAGESNMHVSQSGVLGSSISMQGLSGENVKFLIDGIPVVGRMNGNIDLNQLNLYNVDHVEIIEGPMSVVYGSNAIAGVINIITKENKAASFSSFANAYLESRGVYNFDAGAGKQWKKNTISLDAARNFFGGYDEADTARSQRWKPRRQFNADASYLYSQNKYRIKLTGQYFNEMLLDKGPLLLPYYESAFDNYFTTVRSTGKLEASYSPTDKSLWSVVASYSLYDRVKNRYFKDLTTLNKQLTTNPDDQDTTTIDNTLLRAWYNRTGIYDKLGGQIGIDFNREGGTGKRIEDQKQQIGDYAAFLSLKYDPVKSVSIQPGARVIYNTKYSAPLVYSINLKWQPLENWTARATYARGFRAPALKELYLYFVDINHNVRGNPELKAEYSRNLSLDVSYHNETPETYLTINGGWFYNDISNNITLAPEGNDLYTYINIGKLISQGIRADVSFGWYPALSVKAGFSSAAQSFAFDASSIKSAKRYWNNDFTGSLNYKITRLNLTLSAFYKYTGSMPQVLPNDDRSILVRWVNDYHNLDLTIIRSFWKNHISLSCGVKNLLDVRTVPAVGATGTAHSGGSSSENIAWGRSYFVKCSFNFNKYK